MATSTGYTATATGHRLLGRHLQRRQQQQPGHQRHRRRAGDASPRPPRRSTPASSRPAPTVGTSIADKATVSGGYNPTGTVTFNLYSNSTGTGTPLFTDTNEPLVGGMATSPGYTATATGTDYWVATYNGDSNNNAGHQRHRRRAGDASPRPPRRSTPRQQPASAAVGTSIADKATVSGGYNPTGTVTFNLYNNSTGTGTPLFTDTETLVGGVATSTGYTATATGTDYWVATYNGDSNNSPVTSGTAAEPVTHHPGHPDDQHQPAAGQRHRRQLDRRQGHGQRRVQPDRHRHLQALQQRRRHRHAAVHRHRDAGRRRGHLEGLHRHRHRHRLLGRHLQRRHQQRRRSPAAPPPSR